MFNCGKAASFPNTLHVVNVDKQQDIVIAAKNVEAPIVIYDGQHVNGRWDNTVANLMAMGKHVVFIYCHVDEFGDPISYLNDLNRFTRSGGGC